MTDSDILAIIFTIICIIVGIWFIKYVLNDLERENQRNRLDLLLEIIIGKKDFLEEKKDIDEMRTNNDRK